MKLKFSLTAAFALPAGLSAQPVSADGEFGGFFEAALREFGVGDVHVAVVLICAAIAVIIYGAMVFAILRFRKSAGAKPAKFTHNTVAEVVWTVIPAAVLIGLAVPAAENLIRSQRPLAADIVLEVTAAQWRWSIHYPDSAIVVEQTIVLPLGSRVSLSLTSSDVLHSIWIPELGINQLAIPDRIADVRFEANRLGRFRGQCAELCGMDHNFMPVVVEIVTEPAYRQWMMERDGG